MNNFEKRLFLNYLKNLLPETNLSDFYSELIFEFFLEEFNVPLKTFEIDNIENIQFDSEYSKKFIQTMNSVIKKLLEDIKPKNTLLEKKSLIIKNIYNLNEKEYNIFLYGVIRETNNIIDAYFNTIRGNAFNAFTKKYLNIRVGEKTRITKRLRDKNLISKDSPLEINETILKIFDDKNCNNSTKILNSIIGTPQKSTLNVKDFEHMKKEFNIVCNIISAATRQNNTGINILLYGDVGTGKTEFAKLICKHVKVPAYEVVTMKSDFTEASRQDKLTDVIAKQQLLSNTPKACLIFNEADDIINSNSSNFEKTTKGYLNNLVNNTNVPVIWITNNIHKANPDFLQKMTYCVKFERLSEDIRLSVWHKVLKKNNFKISNDKIEELNKNYNISPSIISNTVKTTKLMCGNENDFEHLLENITSVAYNKKNIKNAKLLDVENYNINLINASYDIEDLTKKIKQSGKLNFSLCLYGKPGTGKSLYARYLAKQLGIEVILKRASDLISSYVGETEQNIAAAFTESKNKKAMLIIDEADTFLQSRTYGSKSWEVSKVNEMLTWMESHDYPFVCTTNLLDSLDEASLRRFTFKINFDFLTSTQVNNAMKFFFGIKNADINIKGLTAGDFATVKKKTDFLNINNINEITNMLKEEVSMKSIELQNSIGF